MATKGSQMTLTGMMCQNRRLLICAPIFFWIVIILYVSLRNKTTVTTNSFIRPRKVVEKHPVNFYLNQMAANKTFIELITNSSGLLPSSKRVVEEYFMGSHPKYSFPPEVVETKTNFNIEEDVLVVIHVQKTGGTIFNQHLVEDLVLERPCNCSDNILTNPCHCYNTRGHVWLFSWFSIGWPCGLHADWTELHECISGALDAIEGQPRQRKYFYVTLLRDPVQRYVSEWRHQRQGHHWQDAKLKCKGHGASLFEVRPCFRTRTWEGVTFEEFLNCRENLATNRQTRMLADLSICNCYHRDRKTETSQNTCRLESAINNMQNMAFFGIMEQEHQIQKLFELTFGLKFKFEFQNNVTSYEEEITPRQFSKMLQNVWLDIELYQFATELFRRRVASVIN